MTGDPELDAMIIDAIKVIAGMLIAKVWPTKTDSKWFDAAMRILRRPRVR